MGSYQTTALDISTKHRYNPGHFRVSPASCRLSHFVWAPRAESGNWDPAHPEQFSSSKMFQSLQASDIFRSFGSVAVPTCFSWCTLQTSYLPSTGTISGLHGGPRTENPSSDLRAEGLPVLRFATLPRDEMHLSETHHLAGNRDKWEWGDMGVWWTSSSDWEYQNLPKLDLTWCKQGQKIWSINMYQFQSTKQTIRTWPWA